MVAIWRATLEVIPWAQSWLTRRLKVMAASGMEAGTAAGEGLEDLASFSLMASRMKPERLAATASMRSSRSGERRMGVGEGLGIGITEGSDSGGWYYRPLGMGEISEAGGIYVLGGGDSRGPPSPLPPVLVLELGRRLLSIPHVQAIRGCLTNVTNNWHGVLSIYAGALGARWMRAAGRTPMP